MTAPSPPPTRPPRPIGIRMPPAPRASRTLLLRRKFFQRIERFRAEAGFLDPAYRNGSPE
jgi:hypothetical protein